MLQCLKDRLWLHRADQEVSDQLLSRTARSLGPRSLAHFPPASTLLTIQQASLLQVGHSNPPSIKPHNLQVLLYPPNPPIPHDLRGSLRQGLQLHTVDQEVSDKLPSLKVQSLGPRTQDKTPGPSSNHLRYLVSQQEKLLQSGFPNTPYHLLSAIDQTL